MANNQNDIPRAWASGKAASGGALHTDGRRLYSYNLCIGVTDNAGRKVVIEVRVSKTTSRHINGAIAVSDRTIPANGHDMYKCSYDCEHIRAIEQAQ